MHKRFDGLHLAHAGTEDNTLLAVAEIALCSALRDRLDAHRNRRKSHKAVVNALVVRNIAVQLSDTKGWQLLALGLTHVKDGNDAVTGDGDDRALLHRVSILILDRQTRSWVDLVVIHPFPLWARRKDLDAVLACFDASAEVLLPCVKASHMRRIGVLQKNKDGVAKAIMMEFGHDSEVFRIASALKNILRAFSSCSIR